MGAVKARCTSPLRLIIEPNAVTFVKGGDRVEYRKLEQCFTCMGYDVENITLLFTDAMGDSPFMIYLDGSKKKVAVRLTSLTTRGSGLALRHFQAEKVQVNQSVSPGLASRLRTSNRHGLGADSKVSSNSFRLRSAR